VHFESKGFLIRVRYLSVEREKDMQNDSTSQKESCESCGRSDCSATKRMQDESAEEFADRRKLQSRLCRIRHKVVVLSGKGGVGKSTVAVNLAAVLSSMGKHVGLLDVDIHGPSIPTMLGLEGSKVDACEDGVLPIDLQGLKVMSLGFLLPHPDNAVIWRGPMKMGVIKQFLKDVAWGDLDYLIVDCPPGTGDEPLSVCQLIGALDGAVVVTTPQKVAAVDVRKSINFCHEMKVPVLGVVENMSGFVCPKCGEVTQILRSGGGQRMAADMGVPFIGAIPMDPAVAESGDIGLAFVKFCANSKTADIMRAIVQPLIALGDDPQPKRACQ
jgi:ATP-binding protein involved in chromosome partitioning